MFLPVFYIDNNLPTKVSKNLQIITQLSYFRFNSHFTNGFTTS